MIRGARNHDQLPDLPMKGRGAVSNRAGRFETHDRVRIDDGWDAAHALPPDRPPTRVLKDRSRGIISRNTSPDVPFDRSINPYRGCEHGCVYCFARPTHCYLGLSAGLDFETHIFAKHDAPELLKAALARPGYRPRTLALGAVTDPYQPIERELRITRAILEVLWDCRHPVTIVTKSAGVLRDLDILGPMAREGLAKVCLSITSLDPKLARRLEPRASAPERRLAAVEGLSQAGVPVAVLTAPMIPALNDHELEALLERSAAAGATSASYVLLRLPLEIAGLFEEWLEAHYPDRRDRVMNLVRGTRNGKLYDSTWGKRQTGSGVYAKLLARRFEATVKRLGLNRRSWELECGKFRRPRPESPQLALF